MVLYMQIVPELVTRLLICFLLLNFTISSSSVGDPALSWRSGSF